MVEHIVRPFARPARRTLGLRVDLPSGEVHLLPDLPGLPSSFADGRSDVSSADFLFGQTFFAHWTPITNRDL